MRIAVLSLLLLAGSSFAEVNKCADQSGKISYSELPCAGKEKAVKRVRLDTVADSNDRGRNWRAEYEALKNKDEEPKRATSKAAQAERAKPLDPLSDDALIKNCEANRGVRCSDPATIAKNRADNTPLTPEQQAAAVAARRAAGR